MRPLEGVKPFTPSMELKRSSTVCPGGGVNGLSGGGLARDGAEGPGGAAGACEAWSDSSVMSAARVPVGNVRLAFVGSRR